ncbi:hypothetical protein ACP275_04G074500 [Erythranthe tilingii]
MTDHKNHLPSTAKPSSIKTRFAIKFLQAMKKLNNNNKNKNTMSEKHKRYLAIRAASHASMASAVGPRRAWSRAVLRKIPHHQKQLHYYSLMNKQRIRRRRNIRRNRIFLITRGNPNNRENYDHEEDEENEEEEDLRELVPGGKEMDFCRLLNETAHYIKCLRAQVQVMTNILDHSSPSNFLYK